MRYKLLGKSGLRVAELCLGTMTFGETWGWGAAQDESRKIYDAYRAAGGNFIDTANRYTEGTAETFIGEFIAAERDQIVLATKYTLVTRHGDPNGSGNQRKNMMQSLEASLKRLNTDYVDIFWLHAWDFLTPVEEIMRGFDDLVRGGKVLYIGISDTPAWIVARAQTIAELRGWTPFIGLQVEYSLVQRAPERDLIPMARALDIGVTAWSPLGGGVLTGKYNRNDSNEAKRFTRGVSERNTQIAEVVQQVAEDIGHSPAQVALNWVRQQNDGGTPIIPILGARKLEQFEQNLACLDFMLSPEQMHRLNEASAIELGFPHDFLRSPMNDTLIYGGTKPLTDDHRHGRL